MEKRYYYDLARLNFDYAIKEKMVDEDYFAKIMDIVINTEGLEDYLKDFKVVENMKNGISCYYFTSKSIEINKSFITNIFSKTNFLYDFNEYEKRYYPFMRILHSFLHEIEHAKKLKICDSDDMSLEAQIIRMCNSRYIVSKYNFDKNKLEKTLTFLELLKYMRIYNKYYKYDPQERLIEIQTHAIVKEISSLLSLPKIVEYEKFEIYRKRLIAYQDILNPTFYYLTKNGYKTEAKEVEK